MKTVISIIFVFLFSFLAFNQKTIDVKIETISPAENDTLENHGFSFPYISEIRLINVGNENISITDTLFIYFTINGDTMSQSSPLDWFRDYVSLSIEEILIGDTVIVKPAVLMSGGLPNGYFEQCFSVQPKNNSNPITDSNLGNNSDCVTRYCQSSLGIESEQNLNFEFWPNPVTNTIHYNLPIQDIQLFSLNGKAIAGIKSMDYLIDVSNIPTGLYFLKFNYEDKLYSKKIVIK
ncbi:T9SS type A sorting domain-containing protein [Brumimicrobium glaciale]|uniref:T9SS type A sorting domain-containing protein n=1 Tax=Brumimicrobium glaciale TaxID=200475 RepID=A0A4Q4KTN5_9FLAO|nr:T9SS type A sorting domain-containing protein [Brumimicrobium glaciale]RYM36119.1 T9SS type A sorting domain-containing protein [Brumimicrobium glaciale]